MAYVKKPKTAKTYPEGTHFNEWFLAPEDGREIIRRFYVTPDGTKHGERYPVAKYQHLLEHQKELEDFVVRLNGDDPFKRRAKELAEIKHAYISEALLEKYFNDVLLVKVDNPTDARTNFRYLIEFGLHFFMVKLKVMSPKDWEKNEGLWAKALLNKDNSGILEEHRLFKPGERKASRTLGYIVFELNRFLKFLHKQRPEEIPLIKLTPLDKKTKDTHDAVRKVAGEIDVSKYVTDEHWTTIKTVLQDQNVSYAPLIYLCRAYGLRRNEGLGITLDEIIVAHLDVTKQLDYYDREKDVPVFKPLKGRRVRKVPHWYADPENTYEWVEHIQTLRTNPDQITSAFAALTFEYCKERYNIDDLRPTFLTDAMSDAVAKDPKNGPDSVRLAAGHASLETTYNHYVKDTRKLGNQVFVPKKKKQTA